MTKKRRKGKKPRNNTAEISHNSIVKLVCKKRRIIDDLLLSKDEIDVNLLREMALSPGGLIDSSLRARAWPKLLHINPFNRDLVLSDAAAHSNPNTEQIRLDINRSMHSLDICKGLSADSRSVKRQALTRMINTIFKQLPQLHYYQGYHDIGTMFLLVCGEKRGFMLLKQYSQHFLTDHHQENFLSTIQIVYLLMVLMKHVDLEVYSFLKSAEEIEPFYAVPWIITGFAHHFKSFSVLSQVYDALLASHPLLPVYLSVACILDVKVRSQLLQLPPDMPSVHSFLQHLPQAYCYQDLIHNTFTAVELGELFSIDSLIQAALQLMRRCKPAQLVKLAAADKEYKYENLVCNSIAFAKYPFGWMKNIELSDECLRKESSKLEAFNEASEELPVASRTLLRAIPWLSLTVSLSVAAMAVGFGSNMSFSEF